jgi:carbon monoxide dehydrogenase subunit G
MQHRDAADQGLGNLFVLSLSRVTQVDRDPDWVFRRLHDPETLLACVPGGSLTRVIDAERFEGRIVVGAGPFKLAYDGDGRITESDPAARTASLRLHGLDVRHKPCVRIRMSMAVHGHSCGSEVQMSFWVMVVDRTGLLNRGWVNPIANDLLDRTVRRIKQELEATTTGNRPA